MDRLQEPANQIQSGMEFSQDVHVRLIAEKRQFLSQTIYNCAKIL